MKTKKQRFSVVLSLVAMLLASCLALISCGNDGETADESEEAKDVYYTVTYSVDGETKTETVKSGDKAKESYEPQKDGYTFYGWYTDENYKKAFSFDTAILSDITLYARLKSNAVAANEYTITFVKDGEVFATAGSKGVVTELPKLDGNLYEGWWVSDYDDSEKLTYQYDGRDLGQSTTLYAVAKSDAPAVSISGNYITWTSKAQTLSDTPTYTLTITDTNGYTLTRNTKATSYEYPFDDKEEGEYEVTVTCNGNTASAYHKNKALNKVSLFEVDGGVITFNSVGAEEYLLTVDCGNKEHNHDAILLGQNTYYDFNNCDMQEGGIKFTVTAKTEGKLSSSATYVYERNLAAVTKLTVDEENDLVSWNAVDGAEGYTVTVTVGENSYDVYVGDATTYSLSAYTGDLSIAVKAEARGYNSSVSAVEYAKTKLAVPANVVVANGKVTWDAVAGAESYIINFNGTEYLASANTYDIPAGLPSKGYEVSVKAVASTSANTSAYSEAIAVKAKLESEYIEYQNGIVSWNPVANAQGYYVSVNGGEDIVVDSANEAAVKFTKGGENTVSVAYIDNRGKKSDYVDLTVNVYEVKFNADGVITETYLAEGDDITFPKSKKTGYTLGNWYTSAGAAETNAAKFSDKTFSGKSNLTLYASWLSDSYTITLVVGEYGEEIEDSFEVYYNRDYVLPIPTGLDNTKGFIGWYTQAESGGACYVDGFGESVTPYTNTDNVVLYARWAKIFNFEYSDKIKINGDFYTGYSVSKTSYANYVKELTIPATYTDEDTGITADVIQVAEQAFMLCSSLKTVNIPDSILDIQTGSCFKWCYDLENVNIYQSDVTLKGTYSSYDGALFKKVKDNYQNDLVEITYFPIGKTGTYTIPKTVNTYDQDGFAIEMPVTQIGTSVFNQSILDKVVISYTVTSILKNAFTQCNSLKQIIFEATPENVTAESLVINPSAFSQCNALFAITLTPRIANFESSIINSCSSLEYVDIVGEGSAYASVEGMITDANKTTLIYVPYGRKGTVVIPMGITTIAANAFRTKSISDNGSISYMANPNVSKVVIPFWVTKIGDHAFDYMSNLKEVVFDGTNETQDLEIGEYAFYNTGISMLTLPEHAVKVGRFAFGRCRNLTSVTILSRGDINTSFAKYAFTDDTNFGYECFIKNVTFGELTGKFDLAKAFDLSGLISVTVDPANTNHVTGEDGVLYSEDLTTVEFYPIARVGEYVVPDTITAISDGFFANNNNITSVVIGAGVTSIGAEAFKNCYSLESVTFAEGCEITSIGSKAFENCYALSSFTLPDSVVTLGKATAMDVFDGCSLLETIVISENNEHFTFDEYGVLYNTDYTKLIFCFPEVTGDENNELTINTETEVIFDRAFGNNKNVKSLKFVGDKITSFGAGLLEGNTTIENIVLPDNVTVISDGMFKGCSSLKKFTISNKITTIETGAFEDCIALSELTIEDGRTEPLVIADGHGQIQAGKGNNIPMASVFSGTKSLQKVTLPDGVYVGAYAFNKSGVKEVEFLGDCTIGAYTFAESGLEKVTFNGAVTLQDFSYTYSYVDRGREITQTISYPTAAHCFEKCYNLHTVEFSENCGITEIPGYFFDSSTALENFELPSTVTEIGYRAFYGTSITSIEFGDDFVGFLGSNLTTKQYNQDYSSTFQNCTKLETVVFNEDCPMTNIGNAFTGCSSLKTITNLPAITKIASNAFSGCAALTEFTIPEGVTQIASFAFKGAGLTSVVIPTTVTTIAQEAFRDCKNLTSFTFADSENSKISSMTGSNIFQNTAITEFEFPETGKPISLSSTGLFRYCETVTKVTLSSGVKNIAYVLNNNYSILDLVITDACDYVDIDGVIFGKSDTTSSILYKAVNPGEEYVIPSTVTTISSYAFSNLTELKKVTIPSSVTALSTYAFYNCEGLNEVEFAEDSKIASLANYAFDGCTSLQKVELPDSVTTLGMYTFADCESLTDLTWNNVTKVDGSTFRNTGFTEINLGDIVDVVDPSKAVNGLFYGCKNLRKVDFTKGRDGSDKNCGITFIMQSMFYKCEALEEVILSPVQTNIESGAFQGCSSLVSIDLSNVTTTVFHHNNSVANSNLFADCTSLEEVVLNDAWTAIGNSAFKNCESLETITLPSSITSIGSSAFENCTSLQGVEIPSGVTTIEAYAFRNCASLDEIDIPSAVTKIGNEAFASTALKEVFIRSGVTELGSKPFAGSKDLSLIIIDGGNTRYYANDDGAVYATSGKLLFVAPAATGKVTVEPNKLISSYAFEGCDGITEVVIPDGINEISDYAFANNSSIKSITLPVTVRTIGECAFKNCTALESIELPDSVSAMSSGNSEEGNGVFEGCTSLTEVKLPANITYIPSACFRGCTSLTSIVIPSKVENIFVAVFEDCTALEEVVLPASLVGLGVLPTSGKVGEDWPKGRVFKNCTSLTSIVIPVKVITAYEDTFYGWTAEQTVNYMCDEAVFTGERGWNNECAATVVYGYTVTEE